MKEQQNKPLISFVVVTHDKPIEIVHQRIIKSIGHQDYPNKELILVGEACEKLDELVKDILKEQYDLKKFRWINMPRPTGKENLFFWGMVARCRNKGIMLARGEY
ncbi:MAG: hypothetical protein MUF15_26275, partial [Acidobacteria bacterium]|nr:hypothetical protein [Acidobacteriota bacterium]